MRALVVLVLFAAAGACRPAALPSSSPAQPDAAFTPPPPETNGGAPDTDGGPPDAGPPRDDGGSPGPDAGPASGIQLDAGWGSACSLAPSTAPRSSSPTALIAAPSDPNWDYERPILKSHAISRAWGASPDDIWAIADQAGAGWGGPTAIAHWDGQGWSIGSPVGHRLHALWGSGRDDVWIGGYDGFLHHFDGATWTVTQVGMPISEIVGTSASDVYMVVEDWVTQTQYADVIRHFDGKTWTVLPNPSVSGHLYRLQPGAPDDLWAIGEGPWNYMFQGPESGTLYHWDGRSWIEDRHWQGPWGYYGTLSRGEGVWLNSPEKGLQRWDGTRWSDLAAPALGWEPQILGLAGGEAWVLSEDGTLMRTDGSCWQTVRNLGLLEEPYTTAEYIRLLFGGVGWVTIADSYGGVVAADRNGWIDRTAESPIELTAISGTSDDDLWIVGERGTILHRTATGWSRVPSGTTLTLTSVWAMAPDDVWVASDFDASNRSAVVLHFDGKSFRPPAATPTPRGWAAIHPTSATDLWLLGGDYHVDRWDGFAWSVISDMRMTSWSTAFWPSGPADVWRAGARGWYGADHSSFTEPLLDHWDGASWTPVATTRYIGDFWGVSPRSIWASSSAGLLHWDGKEWNEVSSQPEGSGPLWASSDDDVWTAMRSGVGHWDGTAWRIFPAQTPIELGGVKRVFGTAPGRVWVIGSAGLVARKKQ